MKKAVPIIIAALIALAALAYVAIPFDFLPFMPMDDIIVAVGAVAAIVPCVAVMVNFWKKASTGELTDEDVQNMKDAVNNTVDAINTLNERKGANAVIVEEPECLPSPDEEK